jgi:hypothetical protein
LGTWFGYRELPWAADRLSGMKQLERNPAVSGLVRFWAGYSAVRTHWANSSARWYSVNYTASCRRGDLNLPKPPGSDRHDPAEMAREQHLYATSGLWLPLATGRNRGRPLANH